MKLNLGCGTNIKEGWTNLDMVNHKGVDVIHDMNNFPYPFEDDTFDEVLLSHILEHLENPQKTIEELYRITKHEGSIKIVVPHFSSWSVWGDPTHKRGYNSGALSHMDVNLKYKERFASRCHSSIIENDIDFIIKKKIIFNGLYGIFQPFVNLHNVTMWRYERFLSGIFPADVMEFILIPVKDKDDVSRSKDDE